MSPPNTFPTDEQRAILESSNRITIAKAGPGSGKTKVFSEFLKTTLPLFSNQTNGLAALSYTNAASDEISQRLGVVVPAQHFVGTLDSFLIKFVLRPFAKNFDLVKGVTVYPPELDGFDTPIQVGSSTAQRASLFEIKFSGGNITNPTFQYSFKGNNISIASSYTSFVLQRKWAIWKNSGYVSHSDCHFLSAYMLAHATLGPKIISILAQKFPWILVDEFQDTGTFLTHSLSKILENPNINSLVVGDPDQAIFEFSGANPENFRIIQNLQGAAQLPITITQRCPKKVAAASEFLSCTNSRVVPKPDAEDGTLTIIPHTHDKIRIDGRLLELLQGYEDSLGSLMFLFRGNKELRLVKGDAIGAPFKLKSKLAEKLSEAVERLRAGDVAKSFNIASAALGLTMVNKEIIKKQDADDTGIDWIIWRAAILNLISKLETEINSETWNAWVARAKTEVEVISSTFEKPIARIGQKFMTNNSGSIVRAITRFEPVDNPIIKSAKFKTIHAAKGTEADTVVLFIPKTKASECVSTVWFDGADEERRVGFVALTRARKNLIIYGHAETISRIQQKSSDFYNLFQLVSSS